MRRWCIGKEILKGWVFSGCCSVTQSCLTLQHPVDGSTPGLPVPHHLPKAAQAPVHCIGGSSRLILCHPLLLLPPIPPSIRVFSNESALHIRWPKYWNFSFSVSPSNEYSGLISFRISGFDLLAVQGMSRVFSSTMAQKIQFFSAQPSLWSNSHICTWLLEHHGSEYLTLETISIFLNISWTCICITLYFFFGAFSHMESHLILNQPCKLSKARSLLWIFR